MVAMATHCEKQVSCTSGTADAASKGSKESIPGRDLSGTTGSQTVWIAAIQTYMTIYADLSTNVAQTAAISVLEITE